MEGIEQIGSFINAGCNVRTEANIIANVVRGFDFIRHTNVYVGIPQEKNSGRNTGITNAELLYIHTNGSPINRIPARPTIEPALAKHEVADQIKDHIIAMITKALAGNLGAAETEAKKAGMIGAREAQKMFGSGELAPNAPITVNGGWIRNRVSGKPVFIKGKKSTAPLIDTGALRQAITYVIRRK